MCDDSKFPADYVMGDYAASNWVGEPPERFWHTCEQCRRREFLSSEEAYEAGWDYPPAMGKFGIISQRNCPRCTLVGSLWWKLTHEGAKTLEEMDARQQAALGRILYEPRSLRDENRDHVYTARYYPDIDAIVALDFDVDRSGGRVRIELADIRKHLNISRAFEKHQGE